MVLQQRNILVMLRLLFPNLQFNSNRSGTGESKLASRANPTTSAELLVSDAAAHQMQEHSESVPGSLRVLQDLRQGLAHQGHGAVQLHVAADQHVTCRKTHVHTGIICVPMKFLSGLTGPVGGV